MKPQIQEDFPTKIDFSAYKVSRKLLHINSLHDKQQSEL